MTLNWTFLSKTSPRLKIHEWIQALDAYNFLKKLSISSTNNKYSQDLDYINGHDGLSVDKKKVDLNNVTYSDIYDIQKIRQILKDTKSEQKQKLKNYQARCYNEELKNKKMIITIHPENNDPQIEMTVHNIVIDMFLIERSFTEEERKKAKDSWIGFTEMKIPENMTETPVFGFENHKYGENIIADLLQKDKVKFDAYLYYMRYIVKDPDFQIDFKNQSPSEIKDLKEKQYYELQKKIPKSRLKLVHPKNENDHDGDIFMADISDTQYRNDNMDYNNSNITDTVFENNGDGDSEDPWKFFEDEMMEIEKNDEDDYSDKLEHNKSFTGSNNNETETKYNEKFKNTNSVKNISPFCINLQTLGVCTSVIGSQYNQRKFSSVSMRSTLFPVTIGIFPYGSISSTGSTHEIVSMLAFMHILIILWELYGPLAFESPVIILKNLVCSGFIGYSVSKTYLLRVYKDYFERIDDFSGIMYRDKSNKKEDKSTILIFAPQGKVCFSGGKNIESVKDHLENAIKMLRTARETPEIHTVSKIIESSWPRSTDTLNKKYESKMSSEMDIEEEEEY